MPFAFRGKRSSTPSWIAKADTQRPNVRGSALSPVERSCNNHLPPRVSVQCRRLSRRGDGCGPGRRGHQILCSSGSESDYETHTREECFYGRLTPVWGSSVARSDREAFYRLVLPADCESKPFRPPLVVLHGGPGIPHNYLLPLSELATGEEARPVLFFDQVGCGESARPPVAAYPYSVTQSVAEVQAAIRQLAARGLLRGAGDQPERFHVYGQSWGGILAFSWLLAGGRPASLTLSNSPADVCAVEAAAAGLVAALSEAGTAEEDLARRFFARHECRCQDEPRLRAAKAGGGAGWRGSEVLHGWAAPRAAALCPSPEWERMVAEHAWPPTLVIGGTDDFVRPESLATWQEVLPDATVHVQEGATHMPFLEPDTAPAYLATLRAFLAAND